MKIKQSYSLSEKTLEKDITKFIRDAKKGAFQYDYKYGQEGLKIIKAYFRMIEEEYKNQNFQAAGACYKKLLFFLLQTDYDYFNYEDIMSKFNSEKFIGLYFSCLVKTCSVADLFKEYLEYLRAKEEYYFASADKTIQDELSSKDNVEFIALVVKESENVKEREYAMYDLVYFQLDLAKKEKDRKKYIRLCEKFEKIVGPEQKEEFDSDG
jgi:hypothetical protein